MCRRQVTPFAEWPDAAYLEALEADADEQTSAATWRDAEASIRKTKGRRKRTRTKSSGVFSLCSLIVSSVCSLQI